ncbi:MAG: glycosyl hydrolase [Proteobacteria bacterium]|nr:glycosyl hydrolase [Pseudomonadota bacterium]
MLALLLPPVSGMAEPLPRPVRAVSAETFLSSLGVNTHIDQGYDPKSYIEPLRFLGVREVRDGERHVDGELAVARATGVRFDIIGGGDLKGVMASAVTLAKAGALLAIEGANEPNNFPMFYNGLQGGGRGHSWYAVAAFQAALYAGVKHDPILASYPVFGPSETGAETDDVGLQFRVIPRGASTIFPPGTHFSDYVNIHNYVSGVHGGYGDNQAWDAASPTLNDRWDGLFSNCGITWFRHFQGYTLNALPKVPRVTTETGWDSVADPGGEATQGAVLTNTYLDQFKRGWRYTFIYELRDEEGGPGHQGLYHGDVPKQAAVDIHNLTTILADKRPLAAPGSLRYVIRNRPTTVHDLLLQKASGKFYLVLWDERKSGQDHVKVMFLSRHPVLKVYDVTRGSEPVLELKHVSVADLTLSDHAVILSISG